MLMNDTPSTKKNTKLIAVLDDEMDILELLTLHLEKANFKVRGFTNAESFFTFLGDTLPELIILDLMLPDMDGLDVCKRIKQNDHTAQIPIIMLTAKGEESDKVIGLELGADDYVTKPFSPKELLARIKAVIRRRHDLPNRNMQQLVIGDEFVIDLARYEVLVSGNPVHLTTTEFRVLQILAEKKGWVFSRDKILDRLWGHEKIVVDRTIDVHIRNLRDKLGNVGKLIKNVRGVGYKLEDD